MSDIFDLFNKIQRKESYSILPITYMIVGLGNPGEKYAKTRHNVGFMALDYFCQKQNVKIDHAKFRALYVEATIGDKRVLLVKPQTFMNASGEAVQEAASFYKIAPENILVIFDDVSLEPGTLRVRRKGSHGGHKGMKSIQEQMSADTFPRIKIGVGAKPHPDYDLADWVLGEFSEADRKELFSCMQKVYECILLILAGETDRAMNLYN